MTAGASVLASGVFTSIASPLLPSLPVTGEPLPLPPPVPLPQPASLPYGASHKNWIRFIRFNGMHRPLTQ